MADVVGMPNQSPYFSATDRRRLAAFAEREGLLLEKSRRTSLPPPIECCVAKLAGNLSEKRVECAILEAVVRSAFLNLHSVEENLAYSESKAQGAHPRKMYFMTFERGPQVFAEIACKAVWNLRSPYKFLLESAAEMNHLIAAQRDALTSIQCCLAKFLREIYYEVEASRKALHEESANPLLALFTIVDKLFRNLDLSLKAVVDKDFGVFERLAVVDVDSSKWSVDMSIEAVSCIYIRTSGNSTVLSLMSFCSMGNRGMSACTGYPTHVGQLLLLDAPYGSSIRKLALMQTVAFKVQSRYLGKFGMHTSKSQLSLLEISWQKVCVEKTPLKNEGKR